MFCFIECEWFEVVFDFYYFFFFVEEEDVDGVEDEEVVQGDFFRRGEGHDEVVFAMEH